jgi:large subunit ribosomal protein L9
LAARLEHLNVEFTAKVGGDGRMFGTISPKEIEEGMKKQWDIVIDKRKFIDKYPANAIGYTRLRIELYKGSAGQVIGTVNVHITEEK